MSTERILPDRPMVERGPWSVRFDGKDIYIDSDDFEHDVCLIVRGDLGPKDGPYRRAYADAIVRILNAAMPTLF